MLLKHLDPKQWDAVDAGKPDRETRDHLATCEECRAVVADSRALLVGLRRTGNSQEAKEAQATGHPAAEALAEYAEGVLFGSQARSVEEHLKSCSVCREDIGVVPAVAVAGDLKEKVSANVRDQLLERLSGPGQRERARSLGEWLVKANRKFGTVFSRLAPADMALALSDMSLARAEKADPHLPQPQRSDLEETLSMAVREVEQARSMMDHAAIRMREASSHVEKILQAIAQEHLEQIAEIAAARTEAAEIQARMSGPVGPLLELAAADVRLRVEARDQERPDVLTVTVITQAGDPAPGVALEMRSPEGEPTLRTTNKHGQASFSLQLGESTLRLVRHGVWELQLARLA